MSLPPFAGVLVRACFCIATTIVLLHTDLVPLGGVPPLGPGSDHGLLSWSLWWVAESLPRGHNPYWTDLLFHPLGSGLAAHTLGPGFVPLTLLTKAAVLGDPAYPLYALRLSTGVSFALGMLLACEAFRSLGAPSVPALAAAAGWAFAAFWRPLVGNPTLTSAVFLLPAVTLAVTALVKTPTTRRAVALGALVGASVYFSEYFSAFIALALMVAVAAGAARADTREELKRLGRALGWRGVGGLAAACLIVLMPFAVNWERTDGRPPPETQIRAGGANLAGFLIPFPGFTPVYRSVALERLSARITRGHGPFLGLPTLLFAAAGIAAVDRRIRYLLLTVAFCFLLLSLGPTLRIMGTSTGWPMPYEALRHIPPFNMARDPQRLAAFTVWALVTLSALGVTAVTKAFTRGAGAGTAVAALALLWWLAEGYCPRGRPIPYTPPPELRRLPPGGVANLPLSTHDGYAMFLQIFHRRPIVTGYVSRTSARQFAHVTHLQDLLDADPEAFVAELRRLEVGTIVLEPGTPDEHAESLGGRGLTILDLREAGGCCAAPP